MYSTNVYVSQLSLDIFNMCAALIVVSARCTHNFLIEDYYVNMNKLNYI